LLKKALAAAKHNVLVYVPKRNEDLWKHGVVEFHQLDKTHKHCGFTKEELLRLVDSAGGKVVAYKEMNETNVMAWEQFCNGRSPKYITKVMNSLFSSKMYFQEIWCEIVKADRSHINL
jgi:hypothetical protein